MTVSIESDARLDPRLRAFLAAIPSRPLPDVESREQLLAEVNSPDALAMRESMTAFMDLCDSEDAAPSEGLVITTTEFTSEPDGNAVNLRIIRPERDEALACVYYIHGGGMAQMSCFDGMYRGWASSSRPTGSRSRWSTSAIAWSPRPRRR